jgi:hypothetical protein
VRRLRGARRGRSLLGAAARTAVIAGTASTVSARVHARHEEATERDRELARLRADQQRVQGGSAAAPAAPIGVDELHAQLTKLGELRDAGLLTDDEFAAQKARLLGAS